MAIRMELSRILIRELNDYQLIELREVVAEPGETGDESSDQTKLRSFPIVIGLPEAQAIDRRLKGVTIKRPQTHDLLASVIGHLGGKLESITINDLSEHTFFATIDIRKDGELIHVDSRPSDAIALGVAGGVPIYVEEQVLESVASDDEDEVG
ncbi:MAG: bifunctional nuclease family protein [Planctomycetota bacterium]|nr:bifunctional nuclease family protein [Planctomycetota bacterium]